MLEVDAQASGEEGGYECLAGLGVDVVVQVLGDEEYQHREQENT